jgi:hypothetical protein
MLSLTVFHYYFAYMLLMEEFHACPARFQRRLSGQIEDIAAEDPASAGHVSTVEWPETRKSTVR